MRKRRRRRREDVAIGGKEKEIERDGEEKERGAGETDLGDRNHDTQYFRKSTLHFKCSLYRI